MSELRLAVAILTMGSRPEELAALLASVAMQDAPAQHVIVVGNGCSLPDLGRGVIRVELPENLGVSGGRNAALRELRELGGIDIVVDLDDDGLLVHADVFRNIQRLHEADSSLGIVSFRIADEFGTTQRRHVPRLRSSEPLRGGYVTTFLGGGHSLSMRMLNEIGDWPHEFFFTHEETDLAWRALDRGWHVLYEPELVLQHPATSPARHSVYNRLTARNRVWLARRNLPALLVPLYLASWMSLTIIRSRDLSGLRDWFRGFIEGFRTSCGARQPMQWRTVWQMTRLGRPPII